METKNPNTSEIATEKQEDQRPRLLKALKRDSLLVRTGIPSGDGGPKATAVCR